MTEIILSLIIKKKDNNTILLASQRIISKIEKLYNDYKEYILSIYKRNKRFNEFGYTIFKRQYKIFLSFENYDYDELIKQGYVIINKNLTNFNPYNLERYENIIINNKNLIIDAEEIINNHIINFLIMHDFYYLITKENTKDDLFMNNNPLKFDELNINEQFLLCDLNPEIKYFSCKCKIPEHKNYFDSTILLYENQIYIGNSSSNPNYTRIVSKYHLSDCTIKISENIKNCLDLFFPENKNNYNIVELIFTDSDIWNKKLFVLKDEIEKSMIKERKRIEDFLQNLN